MEDKEKARSGRGAYVRERGGGRKSEVWKTKVKENE